MLKAATIRLIYLAVLFLANLVLSNLALPEKFGVISLLILNASLLSIVTGFGVDSMALYKVSNKEWNMSQAFHFIWRGIFLQVVIFLLLEIGSVFFFRKTLLSGETPDFFLIDSFYFLGLVIVEKYLSLFYLQDRSIIVNVALATVAFIYLLLLLLCYYFINVPFGLVLYLFAFQNVVQAITLIIFFKAGNYQATNFHNKEFFNALKMSSIVMITNVIQLFAYRLDFWLLKYFYGNYDVGVYAVANKFANFSWILPNIVSHMLMPKYSTMRKEQINELFSVSFYFNFVLIMVTVLLTQLFYFFYLDPGYRGGVAAFYLMLPGYFFWGSVIYFAAYFSVLGKFVYNLIGSLVCFVLIFIADLILIPRFGIKGAALANTMAYSSVFMIYVFYFIRRTSMSINELLVFRKKSFINVLNFVSR